MRLIMKSALINQPAENATPAENRVDSFGFSPLGVLLVKRESVVFRVVGKNRSIKLKRLWRTINVRVAVVRENWKVVCEKVIRPLECLTRNASEYIYFFMFVMCKIFICVCVWKCCYLTRWSCWLCYFFLVLRKNIKVMNRLYVKTQCSLNYIIVMKYFWIYKIRLLIYEFQYKKYATFGNNFAKL